MRVLFRDVIPALLGHRLAPLALCNATVVSEFERLASRLQLLDARVVPQALLASRAGEHPVTVTAHCCTPQDASNEHTAARFGSLSIRLVSVKPLAVACTQPHPYGYCMSVLRLTLPSSCSSRTEALGCDVRCLNVQPGRGPRGRWRCSSPSTRTCCRGPHGS